MAARGKETTLTGTRSLLGTLLVAWTLVSGAALVIATAYWHRTGDIKVLVAWLAPPFAIGTVLFVLVGVVSVVGRTKDTPVEVVPRRGTRQSIFRK